MSLARISWLIGCSVLGLSLILLSTNAEAAQADSRTTVSETAHVGKFKRLIAKGQAALKRTKTWGKGVRGSLKAGRYKEAAVRFLPHKWRSSLTEERLTPESSQAAKTFSSKRRALDQRRTAREGGIQRRTQLEQDLWEALDTLERAVKIAAASPHPIREQTPIGHGIKMTVNDLAAVWTQLLERATTKEVPRAKDMSARGNDVNAYSEEMGRTNSEYLDNDLLGIVAVASGLDGHLIGDLARDVNVAWGKMAQQGRQALARQAKTARESLEWGQTPDARSIGVKTLKEWLPLIKKWHNVLDLREKKEAATAYKEASKNNDRAVDNAISAAKRTVVTVESAQPRFDTLERIAGKAVQVAGEQQQGEVPKPIDVSAYRNTIDTLATRLPQQVDWNLKKAHEDYARESADTIDRNLASAREFQHKHDEAVRPSVH